MKYRVIFDSGQIQIVRHFQFSATPEKAQNILVITPTYPWKPMTVVCRAATLDKPNPPLQRTYPSCAYQLMSSFELEQQPNELLRCPKQLASDSTRNPKHPQSVCPSV
ncbi:hypothetical protein ACJW30_08G113800 [Castanea mollissima]